MTGNRVAKIQERIRQIVSEVLIHETNDPRMRFVTVTAVEVSKDLKTATVRVSVLGSEADRKTCLKGLEGARVRIQSIVGGRLGIRRTPILSFEWDPTIEGSSRVAGIFRRLEEERRQHGGPDEFESSGEEISQGEEK